MPCYHPMQGYRSRQVNPSGKRSIVFNSNQGFRDMPVEIPCGQCIGCRLERSRQWAVRCVHEASLYKDNCFVTLTFDKEHLPKDGSLDVKVFQDFMKRLRFRFSDQRIRFFHCGEYGEKFGRPHYHVCLFNFDFKDKVHFSTIGENKLYVSKVLQELWPFGFSTIGSLTFDSAAYVARYITKKVTGDCAESHYNGRKPEYVTMSRRPGIGRGWLDKFMGDVFPGDFVVMNGKKFTPPKYYGSQFELDEPDVFERIKAVRRRKGKLSAPDNTFDRLRVKESIVKQKFKELKRNYES